MIIESFASVLAARGYLSLTPVQEAVTDPTLETADMLVSAQTGSGKTVGFGLAIAPTLLQGAERLAEPGAPLALIVAPTRELAFQVKRELDWLFAGVGARLASCVGGMDMRDERRVLAQGAHIVVGTPGRLCDHIKRGALDMSSLRAIVLDEADEMLDLGFREDLEFMLAEAPEDRRTLMFSATVPPMIVKLAQQYQRDAVRVNTVGATSQHADIAYQAFNVMPYEAEAAVINLLRYHDPQNAIVFANTRAMVARLAARLANRGFAVVSLSGELSQSERTHALQAMRDGRARVCVATDVAARGIDLPNLDLVVHAELPSNFEGLLHRSGRTGRAGRKGISALVVPSKSVRKAERLLGFAKIQAEWLSPPTAEEIEARDHQRLLDDPIWSDAATPAETAFAAEILALHSPEEVATAFFRLFQARRSAPEELSRPETGVPPAREAKSQQARGDAQKPRPRPEKAPYEKKPRATTPGTGDVAQAPKVDPSEKRDVPMKPRDPAAKDNIRKPYQKPHDRPAPRADHKPAERATVRSERNPAQKPAFKSDGRPAQRSSDRSDGKPAFKPAARPLRKPESSPRAETTLPPRPNPAADTSKRFTPPGKGQKRTGSGPDRGPYNKGPGKPAHAKGSDKAPFGKASDKPGKGAPFKGRSFKDRPKPGPNPSAKGRKE